MGHRGPQDWGGCLERFEVGEGLSWPFLGLGGELGGGPTTAQPWSLGPLSRSLRLFLSLGAALTAGDWRGQ